MNIYKLYYPSVDRNGVPLNQVIANPLYKHICQDICLISGGLTRYPVSGMYINAKGKLIQDDISLLVIYSDKTDEIIKCMHENAMIILKSLNQESVMIEVNNKIEFITG